MTVVMLASRALLLVSCVLFAVLPARAQTVEYTLPTEYDFVPGRLSVTFVDTLTEAAARQVIADLGYAVADSSRFLPVVVEIRSDSVATPSLLQALEAAPEVLGVSSSANGLRLELEPTITRSSARALLHRQAPHFRMLTFEERPHELTIEVSPDEEEAAQERLGVHPLVRYVAYVMAH